MLLFLCKQQGNDVQNEWVLLLHAGTISMWSVLAWREEVKNIRSKPRIHAGVLKQRKHANRLLAEQQNQHSNTHDSLGSETGSIPTRWRYLSGY